MSVTKETQRFFSEVAIRYGIHLSTVHRWRQRGVHGVRLETARIGGKRITSDEALDRFHAAVTLAVDGDPAPPPCPESDPAQEQCPKQFEADLGATGFELSQGGAR